MTEINNKRKFDTPAAEKQPLAGVYDDDSDDDDTSAAEKPPSGNPPSKYALRKSFTKAYLSIRDNQSTRAIRFVDTIRSKFELASHAYLVGQTGIDAFIRDHATAVDVAPIGKGRRQKKPTAEAKETQADAPAPAVVVIKPDRCEKCKLNDMQHIMVCIAHVARV